MAEVILSNRMQALTDMVTPGTVITDVGCDHGFVSVYLVQKGLSPRVIAMDVRSGPLERAREHIREYGLQDRIETRLSDGLHGLKTGEANGMICAGMGGPLMEKILTEGREQAQGFAELILQPQSEIPHFRTFLMDEGYLLLDENIINPSDASRKVEGRCGTAEGRGLLEDGRSGSRTGGKVRPAAFIPQRPDTSGVSGMDADRAKADRGTHGAKGRCGQSQNHMPQTGDRRRDHPDYPCTGLV